MDYSAHKHTLTHTHRRSPFAGQQMKHLPFLFGCCDSSAAPNPSLPLSPRQIASVDDDKGALPPHWLNKIGIYYHDLQQAAEAANSAEKRNEREREQQSKGPAVTDSSAISQASPRTGPKRTDKCAALFRFIQAATDLNARAGWSHAYANWQLPSGRTERTGGWQCSRSQRLNCAFRLVY